MDRKYGDVIELEASASYALPRGFGCWLLYKYGSKLKNKVDGDLGFNYKSLEDETDRKEHVGVIGLSYSTVPLFQAKKFPIPLTVTLSYRNRFAGENLLKSQYLGFGLSVFF